MFPLFSGLLSLAIASRALAVTIKNLPGAIPLLPSAPEIAAPPLLPAAQPLSTQPPLPQTLGSEALAGAAAPDQAAEQAPILFDGQKPAQPGVQAPAVSMPAPEGLWAILERRVARRMNVPAADPFLARRQAVALRGQFPRRPLLKVLAEAFTGIHGLQAPSADEVESALASTAPLLPEFASGRGMFASAGGEIFMQKDGLFQREHGRWIPQKVPFGDTANPYMLLSLGDELHAVTYHGIYKRVKNSSGAPRWVFALPYLPGGMSHAERINGVLYGAGEKGFFRRGAQGWEDISPKVSIAGKQYEIPIYYFLPWNGEIYAATGNGLYVRKGDQWVVEALPGDPAKKEETKIHWLAVHDRRLFVAAESGLYRRDHGGWTSQLPPEAGAVRHIGILNGKFCAATDAGLYELHDDSWRLAFGDDPVYEFIQAPDAPLLRTKSGIGPWDPSLRLSTDWQSTLLNDIDHEIAGTRTPPLLSAPVAADPVWTVVERRLSEAMGLPAAQAGDLRRWAIETMRSHPDHSLIQAITEAFAKTRALDPGSMPKTEENEQALTFKIKIESPKTIGMFAQFDGEVFAMINGELFERREKRWVSVEEPAAVIDSIIKRIDYIFKMDRSLYGTTYEGAYKRVKERGAAPRWVLGVPQLRSIRHLERIGRYVYAGTEEGLFRQRGREDWERLSPKIKIDHFIDWKGTVYVATEQGLYTQKEGRWLYEPLPKHTMKTRWLAIHENRLFAATEDGLYRLGDDGWRSQLPGKAGKVFHLGELFGRFCAATDVGLYALEGGAWRLILAEKPVYEFAQSGDEVLLRGEWGFASWRPDIAMPEDWRERMLDDIARGVVEIQADFSALGPATAEPFTADSGGAIKGNGGRILFNDPERKR